MLRFGEARREQQHLGLFWYNSMPLLNYSFWHWVPHAHASQRSMHEMPVPVYLQFIWYMSSIGRPEHYLLEYVYSARLVQNNQSTNMYIGINVATIAFFLFNVLWTFTEDACYSINRKINWIWGTTIIIRTRFKI